MVGSIRFRVLTLGVGRGDLGNLGFNGLGFMVDWSWLNGNRLMESWIRWRPRAYR